MEISLQGCVQELLDASARCLSSSCLSHIGPKSKRCVPVGSNSWKEALNKGIWKMETLPGDARGRQRRGGFRKLVKPPLVSSELFVVVSEASWSKGVFFKIMEK